jgi:hypothetical protein
VLNSIAQALNLSAEVLLDQAGLLRNIRSGDLSADTAQTNAAGRLSKSRTTRGTSPAAPCTTASAIRADDRLSAAQKSALLSVYDSYISASSPGQDA